MKKTYKAGMSFGLTSGVITTLGLMVGLFSSTESRLAVIGGIVSIAIADALSDAMGMHVAQESQRSNRKQVWETTMMTFLSKFIFAATFIVPIILLPLTTAIIVSIIWGLLLIGIATKLINHDSNKEAIEHIIMTVAVICITYLLGKWIGATFI